MLAGTIKQFNSVENNKKKIIEFLQQNGIKINIDANVVQANSLDVAFDLQSDKYRTYRKFNDHPQYIYLFKIISPSLYQKVVFINAGRPLSHFSRK